MKTREKNQEALLKERSLKAFLLLLAMLLIGLLMCAALVIWYDPFFVYHKPVAGQNYIIDNQINQNPGIARNFQYDSVILGSSMTTNFDTDLFYQQTGLETVKLSYNAAFPKDNSDILPIVFASHPDVKRIFWGIDIHNYVYEEHFNAYPLPEYLYDQHAWNDCAYWFNKEVILQYIVKPHENTLMKDAYSFWREVPCSKEIALANYNRPEMSEMKDRSAYLQYISNNLDQFVIPFIAENPDTTFTFFFPPYSVLYWDSKSREGDLEALLQGELMLMQKVLQYPNVEVYYFQNIWEIVNQLDYYSDYYHYSKEINDYMTVSMAQGKHKLTIEELETCMEEMRLQLNDAIEAIQIELQ